MPKLLEPPFKAAKREEFSWALAETVLPLARTTWKFWTESQTKPKRGLKKDMPPVLGWIRVLGVEDLLV